jgi:AraC-like DNA-binding protein
VRIRDFILRRLPDAELRPRRIATEFRISVRYLHRLFESEDTSGGSFIRDERLKKAAGELADPTMRHLDLKTIAARSGFGGADQFSRAFKARDGRPPGDFRRTDKAKPHRPRLIPGPRGCEWVGPATFDDTIPGVISR